MEKKQRTFGLQTKQKVSVLKEKEASYPLNTPKTRLRTKKEPKITRLTKYTHGSSKPIASFIWRSEKSSQRKEKGGKRRKKRGVKDRNSQKTCREHKCSFFRKTEVL